MPNAANVSGCEAKSHKKFRKQSEQMQPDSFSPATILHNLVT